MYNGETQRRNGKYNYAHKTTNIHTNSHSIIKGILGGVVSALSYIVSLHEQLNLLESSTSPPSSPVYIYIPENNSETLPFCFASRLIQFSF